MMKILIVHGQSHEGNTCTVASAGATSGKKEVLFDALCPQAFPAHGINKNQIGGK